MYLIKFAVETAIQLSEGGIRILQNPVPRFVPESRIFAGRVIIIAEAEVWIMDITLVQGLVFSRRKGCCRIEEAVKTYKIRHPNGSLDK